jgi:homoserine dehydrogenase
MGITAIGQQDEVPEKRPPAVSRRESFKPVTKVAILGFGTVGKAVAELLCSPSNRQLRLTHVFNRDVERKRVSWVPQSVEWTDDWRQVLASDVNVVVEVTGGIEPARQWIQQALVAGKSVVTANKHLMAMHGVELVELAHQTGQQILYGASVAGGVPVLSALSQGLAGDKLEKFAGVLNGTCNYILSNIEHHGTPFAEALAKAQELGYAEADPSDDLNGVDASCKLAIVARVGLHADIRPESVHRQSIEHVEPIDFQFARQLGCTIRQVSMAEIRGTELLAAVGPMLVPFSSPLASARDNQNALIVTGSHGGETVFAGRGAGGGPTAVAVVSDLLALSQNLRAATAQPPLQSYRVSSDFSLSYMIRIRSSQHSKSHAPIAQVLSKHDLEVESVLSSSDWSKESAIWAALVKQCQSSSMEKALGAIRVEVGTQASMLAVPIFKE